MKAIKILNLRHHEDRLRFHLIVCWQNEEWLFWTVLVTKNQAALLRSVFALKKTILMPKHVLTQLGMCTPTLITAVSGGLMENMMRYSALCWFVFVCGLWCDEGCLGRMQHLLWGCIELCIKCNHAAKPWRLIPSVRGSGCAARNSSKCGPRGLCNPFCLPICYIFVLLPRGWGSQGRELNPAEEGWGGVTGQSVNGDNIHAMTQWKWRFLGMFYARMSIQLGLWQGGELQQWRGECGKRPARMLLYVLFSLSSMWCWNRVLIRQWEMHLLAAFQRINLDNST